MVDMTGISSGILKIFSSLIFWLILIVGVVFLIFLFLIIKKRKKLIYPLMELTDLGAGKIGAKIKIKNGAGWFKKKTTFFGLIDYGGEDVLRTWDKREVQNASSEDFHDINGRRGLIVVRKSDDPAILLPVNKAGISNKYKIVGEGKQGHLENIDLIPIKSMKLSNTDFLLEIAPADYRDASSKIIDSVSKETMSKWEKLAPYVVFGLLGIILLVSIIFIVQMVQHGQDSAKDMLLKAGQIVVDNGKNTVPSGAP